MQRTLCVSFQWKREFWLHAFYERIQITGISCSIIRYLNPKVKICQNHTPLKWAALTLRRPSPWGPNTMNIEETKFLAWLAAMEALYQDQRDGIANQVCYLVLLGSRLHSLAALGSSRRTNFEVYTDPNLTT
jgi:hypothetical protein